MSQPADAVAPLVRIAPGDDLRAVVQSAGLIVERPVVVLVGGAGGMDGQARAAATEILSEAVLPAIERHHAAVIDGGTDSGVMQLIGRARARTASRFPLVGVAAIGTVRVPGHEPPSTDAAALEPNHTPFVLVPGARWGDEVPWIADVADAVAGSSPSVTLLLNGGQIAYADAACSLRLRRRLIVLAGTGRTADMIAAARTGHAEDPRAVEIAASPLTTVSDISDTTGLRSLVASLLAG